MLVVEVTWSRPNSALSAWLPGPLPLVQAANPAEREGNHAKTTDKARRTLVAVQQGDALYGRPDRAPVRFHRLGGGPTEDTDPVLALELLQAPIQTADTEPLTGWLAIHVAASRDGSTTESPTDLHRAMLSGPARAGLLGGPGLSEKVQALVPDGVEIIKGAKRRTLSYQTLDLDDGSDVNRRALVAAYLLITSAAADQVHDMSTRALRHSLTIERADWSGLVLRDGAAFIAHQKSREPFAEVLRMLAHSIYLDAMLLALMQRSLVDGSGSRTVDASIETPEALVELERLHFDFKRRYWRTSLTYKRSSPADEILRAFQAELLTAQDVADVQERVQDGARLARSLQAERQTVEAKRQTAQARLLNVLVEYTSIIVGVLGLTFTAAPVVATPSWRLFTAASGIGILTMGIAFLIRWLIRPRIPRPALPSAGSTTTPVQAVAR